MSKNINITTLDWARYYVHDCGFSVIPLKAKSREPALTSWKKYQKSPPSAKELDAWFGNGSQLNIGIVTGKVSGIAVVDLDSIEAIKFAQENKFPKTPGVKTRPDRFHLYFKYKDGVRNFQQRKDLPNIDMRGEGGYVVAPPSIHELGHQYEWIPTVGPGIPRADLPEMNWGS